jgi:hypothetical protein
MSRKKLLLEHKKLSFLHRPQKLIFFRDTLCAGIEYVEVHPEFIFEIFRQFEISYSRHQSKNKNIIF